MGKKVHLQHLSRDCGELLKQAAGGAAALRATRGRLFFDLVYSPPLRGTRITLIPISRLRRQVVVGPSRDGDVMCR